MQRLLVRVAFWGHAPDGWSRQWLSRGSDQAHIGLLFAALGWACISFSSWSMEYQQ